MQNSAEFVRRRFRSNPLSRELLSQQVLDEGCLARRIRSYQQDERRAVKLSSVQKGETESVVRTGFFNWEHCVHVQALRRAEGDILWVSREGEERRI